MIPNDLHHFFARQQVFVTAHPVLSAAMWRRCWFRRALVFGRHQPVAVRFSKTCRTYARHRTPRFWAPHGLSFLTACASETAGRFWPNWTPFVTRESVRMSRGPHFLHQCKGGKRTRLRSYVLDRPAIHDAVEGFVARGLALVAARDQL